MNNYKFDTNLKNMNFNLYFYLFIISLFCSQVSFAQAKFDILALKKADSLIIITATAPKPNEGINFYKKSGNQFILLNTEGPVTQIVNHNEIKNLFGNKWPKVMEELSINDPSDIIFRINEQEVNFLIMSLKFPEIFRIAGAWFVDKTYDNSPEVEFKLEYIDLKSKNIKKTISKKIAIRNVMPDIPTNLSAEVKESNITLKWNYPKLKNDFSDLTIQFNVYRKAGNEEFKKINDGVILRSEDTEFLYLDNNVKSGVEYSYYVTAVDIIGNESSTSRTITSTWIDKKPPAIPEDLKADSVNGAIGISWRMNLELDAKGYNVYRAINSDKDFVKLNDLPIPIDKTFYYDNSFEYGIQYFYRVTCLDNNGNESEKSNPIAIIYEDTTPPEAPTNLKYNFENKTLRTSWTPSKSNDVAGYFYYRGETKELLSRVNHEPVKDNFFNDTGIEGKGFVPGGKYTIAVTAYDKARNESQKVIIEDILIPDNEPPSPPSGLMTENLDANYIQITCSGSSSLDVKSYKLFRYDNDTPDKPKELASFEFAPFYYLDTNVQKLKTYYYYAIAIDKAGNESPKSNIDTVRFIDYTPPPSVKYIKAFKRNNGIEIKWEAVYDFDLLGYNIYKSDLPNGFYKKINKDIIKNLNYLDPQGKKTEFYIVKAIDTSGNESLPSDFASPEE